MARALIACERKGKGVLLMPRHPQVTVNGAARVLKELKKSGTTRSCRGRGRPEGKEDG